MIFNDFIYVLPLRYWKWTSVEEQMKQDHTDILQEVRLSVRDRLSKVAPYKSSSDLADSSLFGEEKMEARSYLFSFYNEATWFIESKAGATSCLHRECLYCIADLIVEVEDLTMWKDLDAEAMRLLNEKEAWLLRLNERFLLAPVIPLEAKSSFYKVYSAFRSIPRMPEAALKSDIKGRTKFFWACITNRSRQIDIEQIATTIGLFVEFYNGSYANQNPSILGLSIAKMVISFLA